jgi:hypothetical protein
MKYTKLIYFILLALVVSDTFLYISFVGALNVNNATYISTALHYISIGIMLYITLGTSNKSDVPSSINFLFKIWLFWVIFEWIRGFFIAQDYWDYKFLFLPSLSFSLIPLVLYLGNDLDILKINLKYVFKYLFPFGFIFIPLALATNDELYSRLMIGISFFILLIPYINKKRKLLVLIVAITSMVIVLDFRSNVIKCVFSFGLLGIYFLRNYINLFWLKIFQLVLFSAPIILLFLAVNGKYNVFEDMSSSESVTVTTNSGDQEDLMDDTRTLLYVETLLSLNNTTEWIIGKSAIGSYMTDYFYNDGGDINGRRFGSEVGILNIILRYGIIGFLSYFLLLFVVSWIAISKSSNYLSKMIGLFIAFRFTYSFIEEFTQYDTNFYFFWLVIGLVSSSQFRNMTDDEIENYLSLENE